MNIPLVDLSAQHDEVADEVNDGFSSVIEDNAFILGPQVAEFEQAFASACGTAHCIGVGSGTDALEFGLRALELPPDSEVIVPANTFIASALAVLRAGARPVLVDCDPDYHLIDVKQVAGRLSPRTGAIMAVDLYGQVAPMDSLTGLAQDAGVVLVEDAAQAHGARQGDRRAGSFGKVAGFSFYPSKNLGAYGDGGAVMTSDGALAERLRRLRNWGSDRRYHHPQIGFNSRLDSLQAVVLHAKLRRLDDWNRQRREAAARYETLLADSPGIELPRTRNGNEHAWHLYVVRVSNRDRVLSALHDGGIGAGVHYPVPLHLQNAFKSLGHQRGDFPVTELAAQEVLSLPMYPGITEDQQSCVAEALRRAVS